MIATASSFIKKISGNNRYDLPLHKKAGTGFILWVIALMTFLCAMTLAGSFMLSNLTSSWEQGLQGQLTIEIRPNTENTNLADDVITSITTRYSSVTATAIDQSEFMDMLSPWIGEKNSASTDDLLKDFPLPTLIAVATEQNITDNDKVIFNQDLRSGVLENDLKKIDTSITIDTHETWLNHLINMSHKIRNLGYLIAFIIGATTIAAVAGASRSRITMNQDDIELLHLIGASDHYIAKQFSRHSAIMTLEGACVGLFMALSALFFIENFHNENAATLSVNLDVQWMDWLVLIALPFIGAFIAYITTEFNARRFLRKLP